MFGALFGLNAVAPLSLRQNPIIFFSLIGYQGSAISSRNFQPKIPYCNKVSTSNVTTQLSKHTKGVQEGMLNPMVSLKLQNSAAKWVKSMKKNP